MGRKDLSAKKKTTKRQTHSENYRYWSTVTGTLSRVSKTAITSTSSALLLGAGQNSRKGAREKKSEIPTIYHNINGGILGPLV